VIKQTYIRRADLEVVFALPNDLATVQIEPERGFVVINGGLYDILNPAELPEKLLDILELSEESLDASFE